MDVFNALWDNAEQRKRPPDDNFQPFTMEEWLALSSTHKILSGSLKCPLPPELEPNSKTCNKANQNSGDSNKTSIAVQPSQGTSKPVRVQTNPPSNAAGERVYIPGLTKLPESSRLSSLTIQEHKDFLMLLQKFDGKTAKDTLPSERAEYQLYQSLYIRVKEEQKDFLELAKFNWPSYVSRTSKIKGDPHMYVLTLWRDKVQRALAQYSDSYRRLNVISLDHSRDKYFNMYLSRNLLKIGKVPFMKLPPLDKPYRVATSLVRLRTWGLYNLPPSHLMGTLHKITVSRDPNAERLARLSGANVVISASGFKCLLDNYDESKHPNPSGVGKSWVLPVIVKEHRSFENGKPVTKTTVFIDKVLPQSKMTTFEKNYVYQKHALLAAIVHRHHEGGIQFEPKGIDLFIKREIPDDSSETNIPNAKGNVPSSTLLKEEREPSISLRTFDSKSPGIKENITSLSQQPSKASEVQDSDLSIIPVLSTNNQSEDHSDDSSGDESLVIAFSEEESEQGDAFHQSKHHKKHQVVKKHDEVGNLDAQDKNKLHEKTADVYNLKTCKPESSVEKYSGLKSASKDTLNTVSYEQKTPALRRVETINGNALPFNITNVIYNLWCLQPQVDGDSMEAQSESNAGIKMLIRSRIDGCESMTSGNYEPLSIVSKPEFQLEFGAGAVPLSDLTRQWAKLLILPESLLARVRVNVHNSEIVKVEKKTRADVEKEAQNFYQVDLNKTLGTLHTVLKDLVKLPCGEYVLSHSPEMGLAAQLLVKSEGKQAADWIMSSEYGDTPQEICCDTPWQPLDTAAIMPRNEFFNQIPCTFQSRRDPKTNMKRYQPTQAQMRKQAAANNSKTAKNAKKKAAKLRKKNENKKTQE